MITKKYRVDREEQQLWVTAKNTDSELEIEEGTILNIVHEPSIRYFTDKEAKNQAFLEFFYENRGKYDNLNELRTAWKNHLKKEALFIIDCLKEGTDLSNDCEIFEFIEDFNYQFKRIKGE
jgi:hypothetical protein